MNDLRAMLPRSLRPLLANLRRFFDTGNVLRFLLSMVLAFGLWAWVTYENDPETTRVLGGMPVTLSNLDNEFEIVGDPPLVDVTIQGPQSVVSPLDRESVTVLADMSEVDGTGDYEIDVEVVAPSGVRIRDIVPETLELEVDQFELIEGVPVEVREPDDVPPELQVSRVSVDPETVDVSGPARVLEQIDRLDAQANLFGRSSSFTASVEVVALNSSGDVVQGVEISPPNVNVTVTLDVRGNAPQADPDRS
jgi:YbbR domain-containing protein